MRKENLHMKCFSIDLDGTLLNSTFEISNENLKVLHELKNAGHSVIINTGRALDDVISFEALRDLQCPIITINGTVLYSEKRDVIFEASLPLNTYKEIFPVLKNLGLWVMVYTNQGGFPFRYPAIKHLTDDEIDPLFAGYDYEQMFKHDDLLIYKVMGVSRHNETDKVTQAQQLISQLNLELSMASSHPNNIEFTSKLANKGAALERYQQLQGIKFEEIFTFGDGGNDVPQFKVATTAVAMGNAPLHIQKEADIVTKTNDEDGFAYAVRHLLKL